MKRLLYTLVVIALAILCMPWESFAAGDTLTVVPASWNTVINGDTLAGGVRAHPDRVYRFQRGKVYQVSAPLVINGNFTAIANDSTGIRPPVLAPAILLDNSSVDHYFDLIGKGSKFSISNLYLLSQRSDNTWLGWSDGIRVNADSVSVKMRGVIAEGWSDVFINPSFWMKTDWQDCTFRNLQHASSWFGGQVFRGAGSICLDTTKIINCTFFSNNSYLIDIRGYTPLAVFEHNTCVYGVVNPFLIRQADKLHIKNNIMYAMHAFGGNPTHVIDGWFLNYPDTGSSPIIQFRANDSVSYWSKLWKATFTGPEAWVDAAHGVTAAMLDNTKRTFDVRGNDWFLPAKLTAFVKQWNDTVATYDSIGVPVYGTGTEPNARVKRTILLPTWVNAYVKWTIDSLAGKLSPNINIEKTPMNLDPGFSATVNNQVDQLLAYIYRISTNTLNSQRWTYPDSSLYLPPWPLPESFAYTNTTLQHAATDGFAVGDLNWFPSQKTSWLATGVEKVNNVIPTEFTLTQNYPNPFNPTTNIEFSLPKAAKVSLVVYNLLGQQVATLVNGTLGAGSYTTQFDGAKLASGTYIYRLSADGFTKTSKMLLVK